MKELGISRSPVDNVENGEKIIFWEYFDHTNEKILDDNIIEASENIGGNCDSQDLFRYLDKDGNDFDIKSYHVNNYLDEITPNTKGITAKDFRTWSATYKTAYRLSQQLDPNTQKERKQILSNVIKTVSADLGNTPTVCRSSYIHPKIINDWENGSFRSKWNHANKSRKKLVCQKKKQRL